ncbi:uncharacterized protein [Temnothorax nylanderi]|uniref:uncharacterized protein isoform X5 n=1 Tax=Temnothorax nylanderi TaxID=102681 RepID=UPI003A8382F6
MEGYNTEREQKLIDLPKSGLEERDTLLQKQEELTSELKSLRATADASAAEVKRLTKCAELLEASLDSANVERKQLDMELAEARQKWEQFQTDLRMAMRVANNLKTKP